MNILVGLSLTPPSLGSLVDRRGIEPLTPWLQTRTAINAETSTNRLVPFIHRGSVHFGDLLAASCRVPDVRACDVGYVTIHVTKPRRRNPVQNPPSNG